MRYTFGQTLFHEGDHCEGVAIIIEGLVRISSYTLDGRQIVYNILDAGDIFGNNLVFSSDDTYRGSVVGQEDGEALFIPKEALLEILQSNAAFLREYLRRQSDFGKQLNARIKILSMASPEERLDYLLSLNKGVLKFRTISDLAMDLQVTRETLSRLIHRKAREGSILLKPHQIIAAELASH